MRTPDECRRDLVWRWVAKAEDDIRLVKHLLDQRDDFPAAVCFHAQQAVEKYLKAILVHRQVEFPKTHDLARLLDLAAEVDPALAEDLAPVTALTPFAITFRYPGDAPPVTLDEARRAAALAEKARAAIQSKLPGTSAGDRD